MNHAPTGTGPVGSCGETVATMRRLAAFVVLLLLLAALPAAADFSFVWLTDLHIGHGPAITAAEAWTAEVAAVQPAPAFVVVTGDVTEFGAVSDYDTLRRLTDKLPLPLHLVPGNHDSKWAPLGRFQAYVGPRRFSFDHEGVHFVGLNSSVQLRGEGAIGLEQLAWLARDLGGLKPGTPVIAFLHHPVGDMVSLDDEQALLDVIAGHNVPTSPGRDPELGELGVALILAGHTHNEAVRDVNGVCCVTGNDPWAHAASWYLVEVGDDEAVIRRKRLGQDGYADFATADLRPRQRPRLTITAPTPGQTIEGDLSVRASLVGADDPPQSAEFRVDREGWQALTIAGNEMRSQLTIPQVRELTPGQHVVRVRVTLPDERLVLGAASFTTPDDRGLWRTRIGELRAPPAMVTAGNETFLVAGTTSGNLVALDHGSGRIRAACRVPGAVYGRAGAIGDLAVFGCEDGHLYGFRPATGRAAQLLTVSGPIFSGIATDGDLAYFGTGDGAICCADPRTRELVWRTPARDMVEAKPLVREGRLYVADWANTVHCLNAATGDVLWQQTVGSNRYYSPAGSTPVILGDALYLVSPDQHLYCLDLATGEVRWRKPANGYDSIAASDRHVIIRGLDSMLHLYDPDGTLVGSSEAGWGWDHAAIPPVVSDGRIYCASKRGVVSAFEEATGRVLWQHKASNLCVFAPVLVTEDAVYVGSTDGFLTALRR